jgi:cystathionine beta-lyase/cystathionine gamma-synthase
VRIAIGCEDAADLCDDLEQALEVAVREPALSGS